MQSHELLREVLQKTSAKQVAADLGLSLSMIYKWAEPDRGEGSGTANPLDRLEALCEARAIPGWSSGFVGGRADSLFRTRRPTKRIPII